MSKIYSIVSSLITAAFVTALAFTTNVFFPLKTLSQALPSPSKTTSPASGCISGYLNGTYQGNRPITRNEFAVGLNACLNQVNQLPINKADLATRKDFQNLIDRQIELNRQLQELNERVITPPAQK